jgi:DNA-binding cell septation regulator SpoVG
VNPTDITPCARRFTLVTGQGNLRGYVDVQVGLFLIRGCRVIQEGTKRAWASLPQQQAKDGRWYPILEVADKGLEERIKAEALRFWAEEVGATL